MQIDNHLALEIHDALDFALKIASRHDSDTITLTVPRAREFRRRLAENKKPATARREPNWVK